MTDHAYTDDDLRAEAARQHAGLTEDPDYMGVGEGMDGRYVRYEVVDPEHGDLMPPPGTPKWDDLSEDEFDEARQKIHDLINGAVDVSEWAVNLGADGLQPDEHQFTLKADERPIIRAHFAFVSELRDESRTAFVEGLGAAAAREMQLALEGPAEASIPTETAAHVLFQERLGGWPPSTFASKLLDLWTSADTENAECLAVAFPEYAAAIALVRSGAQGIEQLHAIADGT